MFIGVGRACRGHGAIGGPSVASGVSLLVLVLQKFDLLIGTVKALAKQRGLFVRDALGLLEDLEQAGKFLAVLKGLLHLLFLRGRKFLGIVRVAGLVTAHHLHVSHHLRAALEDDGARDVADGESAGERHVSPVDRSVVSAVGRGLRSAFGIEDVQRDRRIDLRLGGHAGVPALRLLNLLLNLLTKMKLLTQ